MASAEEKRRAIEEARNAFNNPRLLPVYVHLSPDDVQGVVLASSNMDDALRVLGACALYITIGIVPPLPRGPLNLFYTQLPSLKHRRACGVGKKRKELENDAEKQLNSEHIPSEFRRDSIGIHSESDEILNGFDSDSSTENHPLPAETVLTSSESVPKVSDPSTSLPSSISENNSANVIVDRRATATRRAHRRTPLSPHVCPVRDNPPTAHEVWEYANDLNRKKKGLNEGIRAFIHSPDPLGEAGRFIAYNDDKGWRVKNTESGELEDVTDWHPIFGRWCNHLKMDPNVTPLPKAVNG